MRTIYVIILSLLIFGCTQAEIPTYSGGDYVQFDTTSIVRPSFSFAYSGSEAIKDTVYVDLIIGGPTRDYDRVVKVRQIKEYQIEYILEDGVKVDSTLVLVKDQAVPGKHYVAFNDPEAMSLMFINKNQHKGKLGIVLKRDATLKATDYSLLIEILQSDDFLPGDFKSVKKKILIIDKLIMPDNWNHKSGPNIKPQNSPMWGVYGPVKHQFMIDHSPNSERWDAAFLEELNKDDGLMMWYQFLFIRALEKVNAERAAMENPLPPLAEDPNNQRTIISFP